MGAGKGQSRRVQSIPNVEVKVNIDRWDDFVVDSGCHKVKLYEYYLGDSSGWAFIDEERAKITINLFTDMVFVGAISLPGAYRAEDFQFVTGTAGDRICLKSKPDDEVEIPNLSYNLSPDRDLVAGDVHKAIRSIMIAIEKLVWTHPNLV